MRGIDHPDEIAIAFSIALSASSTVTQRRWFACRKKLDGVMPLLYDGLRARFRSTVASAVPPELLTGLRIIRRGENLNPHG
jgi:hypothetical protein